MSGDEESGLDVYFNLAEQIRPSGEGRNFFRAGAKPNGNATRGGWLHKVASSNSSHFKSYLPMVRS